jgi:hypothetical protein
MATRTQKHGRGGKPVVQAVALDVQSVDAENYTVTGVFCTEDPNRNGEMNLLAGMDLSAFLLNPVLQWSHSWLGKPEPEDVLGNVSPLVVADGVLSGSAHYAARENPKAMQAWNLVAGGYLRGYSIGFLPTSIVGCWDDSTVLETLPDHARQALESGAVWAVNVTSELMEISQVLTGADRKSVTQAVRDGACSPDFARLAWERSGASELVMPRTWAVASKISKAEEEAMKIEELSATVQSLAKKVQALEPAPPGSPAQEAALAACSAGVTAAGVAVATCDGIAAKNSAAGPHAEAAKQALAVAQSAADGCMGAEESASGMWCSVSAAATSAAGVCVVAAAAMPMPEEEPAEEPVTEEAEDEEDEESDEEMADAELQALVDEAVRRAMTP